MNKRDPIDISRIIIAMLAPVAVAAFTVGVCWMTMARAADLDTLDKRVVVTEEKEKSTDETVRALRDEFHRWTLSTDATLLDIARQVGVPATRDPRRQR